MELYVYILLLVGIYIEVSGVPAVASAVAWALDNLVAPVIVGLVVYWLTRDRSRCPQTPPSGSPGVAGNTMRGANTAPSGGRYHAGRTGTGRGEDVVPDNGAGERVTLREAAVALGISEGGVRKRVKRGSLRSDLGEDGRRYVYLDGASEAGGDGRGADGGTDAGADAFIAELRDRVRYMERQLEAERQAHAEARRIIGGLVQRIPELEAPREPSSTEAQEAPQPRPGTPTPSEANGGPQTAAQEPQRLSWWSRMFGA